MFSSDDKPPAMGSSGSQFAVRVAVLGGFALVAFAVIFFRLWFLQILDGEEYLAEANNNRVREIRVQAPRGEILDSGGKVLVDNRKALLLQVRPDRLPRRTPKRNDVLRDLSKIVDLGYGEIKKEIRKQTNELPASPVTLKRDVKPELAYYLAERQDQFPGVTTETVFVREYPNDTLAAHLFGYVSEVGKEQLSEPQYDGLEPGDRIGASGVELQYDSVLRGRNGATRVQVDALGRPRGRELSEVEPKPGNNLVLTLDREVQEAGEAALAEHAAGKPGAAFVALDVRDGSVLGMGSIPTYDPSVFTPPVDTDAINALTEDENQPLFNNATQSGYPTGSTFKLITATMALEEGLITPEEIVNDPGYLNYGGRKWSNAGDAAYGAINMTDALQFSSDVYFYLLGLEADQQTKGALQHWATQLGFGNTTGIDLPGEGAGLVPSPEWRNELFEDGDTDRPWTPGDNMNLAVGQGDLQATPLQLAIAYATVANGGDVVRPHVADHAVDSLGRTVQEFDPEPRRELDISDETQSTILEGLRRAAMEPGGTSADVFAGFPVEIAGKTGTAERFGYEDQSWYAAIAPFDNPRIAVVVTIEQGGFGAEAAAPAVRDILTAYFKVDDEDIETVDAGSAPD